MSIFSIQAESQATGTGEQQTQTRQPEHPEPALVHTNRLERRVASICVPQIGTGTMTTTSHMRGDEGVSHTDTSVMCRRVGHPGLALLDLGLDVVRLHIRLLHRGKAEREPACQVHLGGVDILGLAGAVERSRGSGPDWRKTRIGEFEPWLGATV